MAALPEIYIHGIWLPRHGVNDWASHVRSTTRYGDGVRLIVDARATQTTLNTIV